MSRFVAACAISMVLSGGQALAAMSAQEILKKSDAVRNPDRSFSLVTTMVSFKNGKQDESNRMTLYSRAYPNGGQFRSLLRFISPQRDAGKLTLKSGRDLWLFDPSSQASVPISPQQRLLGQASNGDVVTANWSTDYQATLVGEERIQDGDRQMRDCYRLHLVASNPDAAYPAMELWVDRADFKSRKAEFYAISGGLLKTTYYRRYEQALGGVRPMEAVIIDGVDANLVTVIRHQDFAWRDVPEAWLQRDYLPHFKDN
ncbi:outer membrane lipoprotein-sorting protein [Paraburkholderia dinghuensis]|uniref:Outer membrane lipoprotein-sorting protein n=2 Tax=Paraburkholderia dinghuensis TaxID=2305225 RepID=A0A3N6N644_9BURK|nr:outer membrane lipoprotein-sorting protein [Paraburkholderia dinghuensis]